MKVRVVRRHSAFLYYFPLFESLILRLTHRRVFPFSVDFPFLIRRVS